MDKYPLFKMCVYDDQTKASLTVTRQPHRSDRKLNKSTNVFLSLCYFYVSVLENIKPQLRNYLQFLTFKECTLPQLIFSFLLSVPFFSLFIFL